MKKTNGCCDARTTIQFIRARPPAIKNAIARSPGFQNAEVIVPSGK